MTQPSRPGTSRLVVPLAKVQAWGDGPHALSHEGRDLVFVRGPRGPRVFHARCPHQGALLSEGEIQEGALVCRNHRWRFDLDTGAEANGRACLTACPVAQRGDELEIEVASIAGGATAAAPRQVAELPGPRGLPVLGHLFTLELNRLHEQLEAWGATHGSAYHLRILGKPILVISEPSLVQTVFRSRPDVFRRTSKVEKVFEELGVAGVFSAEGAAWRAQRKLAMEALAQRNLVGFYPTLRTVAGRLRGRWERASSRGDAVDMLEDLKRFTVDVTTALTFGEDLNTLEQTGDAVVQRRLELLFPTFQRRIFASVPLWRLIRTPRDRQVDRAVGELRVWLSELVTRARARLSDPATANAQPRCFLEAMVAARDEEGRPFSDEIIFGNLMTMLLAGEDTTAYTLAWAVHHLCDHPEAVSRLRDEVDALPAESGVPVDLDTALQASYAGAVANEAMRLRPVAPLVIFEALAPTVLGDIAVEAGGIVMTLTRPPNLGSARFSEPERFWPDRWVGPQPGIAHDASAHIPFGSGPRICPGRSLALLEMKVVLAMLYRNFDVVRAGSHPVEERFAFTMSPSEVRVSLTSRAPAQAVPLEGSRRAPAGGPVAP